MTISRARSAGLAGDTALSSAASALPRNSRNSWSNCSAAAKGSPFRRGPVWTYGLQTPRYQPVSRRSDGCILAINDAEVSSCAHDGVQPTCVFLTVHCWGEKGCGSSGQLAWRPGG